MNPPLVTCAGCSRTWHSRTMADGLRTIGCCPRCRGTLVWDQQAGATAAEPDAGPDHQAPHLVLGLPRR